MKTVTTSIRLPSELREQLEQAAHSLHRGKNWIITHALEDYLAKISRGSLAREARRQSLLAKSSNGNDEFWEQNSDTDDWKE